MAVSRKTAPWIATVVGSILLLWNCRRGFIFFIQDMVDSTLTLDAPAPAGFVTGYLLLVVGFALLAFVHASCALRSTSRRDIGAGSGVVLMISGFLLFRAFGLVIKAFSNLSTTGMGDPAILGANLSEATPFLWIGVAGLCLSTAMRCSSVGGASPDGAVRWMCIGLWGVAVVLLTALVGFVLRLQEMVSSEDLGASDPAEMAGQLSKFLIGETIWGMLLMLLGVVTILAGAGVGWKGKVS